MTKKIIYISLLVLQTLTAIGQGKIQIKAPSASPAASFEQEIGSAMIKVSYNRPLVRNRVIFGALIPFDILWRTGASGCTTLATNEEIIIGNNPLPAGKYALFTIPSKNEWTIIINKDTTLHGDAGYDEKKDLFRFKIPSEKTTQFYETFTIELNDINSKGEGFLKLAWENTIVRIPLKSIADQNIVASIDKYIVKGKMQDANLLFQSANYYATTNRDSKQAISWLLEAEKLDPENFYYPNLRQKLLGDLKDYPAAIEAAKKALALAEIKKMNSNIKSLKTRISEFEVIK